MYVKSGRSGAFEPGKLGLSCEVNKCSDAGTVGLGVLPAHETFRSTQLVMSVHPAPDECRKVSTSRLVSLSVLASLHQSAKIHATTRRVSISLSKGISRS